jgi:hypothetical protein
MTDSVTFDSVAMDSLPEDGVPEGLHFKEEAEGEDEEHAWLFKQVEFECWWDSQAAPLSIPNLLVRDSLRSWWCTYADEHSTSKTRFAPSKFSRRQTMLGRTVTAS